MVSRAGLFALIGHLYVVEEGTGNPEVSADGFNALKEPKTKKLRRAPERRQADF